MVKKGNKENLIYVGIGRVVLRSSKSNMLKSKSEKTRKVYIDGWHLAQKSMEYGTVAAWLDLAQALAAASKPAAFCQDAMAGMGRPLVRRGVWVGKLMERLDSPDDGCWVTCWHLASSIPVLTATCSFVLCR